MCCCALCQKLSQRYTVLSSQAKTNDKRAVPGSKWNECQPQLFVCNTMVARKKNGSGISFTSQAGAQSMRDYIASSRKTRQNRLSRASHFQTPPETLCFSLFSQNVRSTVLNFPGCVALCLCLARRIGGIVEKTYFAITNVAQLQASRRDASSATNLCSEIASRNCSHREETQVPVLNCRHHRETQVQT